jgi:hypothetical protein
MPQPRKASPTPSLRPDYCKCEHMAMINILYGSVCLKHTPRSKPVATYCLAVKYYFGWNGNIPFFSKIRISTYVFARIYSVVMLL